MAFPAFSRSLNKAKRSLLKEHVEKYVVAKALFEDSIEATPKENMTAFYLEEYTQPKKHNIGYPAILTEDIREKLDAFLCHNDTSFTLPGHNNQVYIGKNEHRESLFNQKSICCGHLVSCMQFLTRSKMQIY